MISAEDLMNASTNSKPYQKGDKFVFVIDGNYFGRRIDGPLRPNGKPLEYNSAEDCSMLYSSLINSFCTQIKLYGDCLSRVLFVRDTSSWRKDIKILRPLNRPMLDKPNYKDNRNYTDDGRNWDAYHGVMDKFRKSLDKLNVPTVSFEKAEGDDCMFVIAKLLSMQGLKVILWTADGDMVQLVDTNICQIKPQIQTLVMSKEMKTYYDGINNASMIGVSTDQTSGFMAKFAEVNVALSMHEILAKIVKGDDGDNVPPILTWQKLDKNKDLKWNRPSAVHIKKALEKCGKTEETITLADIYDDEFVTKFITEISAICHTAVYKDGKKDRPASLFINEQCHLKDPVEYTKKVFECVRNLTVLNQREIPKHIVDGIRLKFIDAMGRGSQNMKMLTDSGNFASNVTGGGDEFFSKIMEGEE